MVDSVNYLYIYGHLPVIIAVAFWLYMRHRDNYALFRNAFLISGLIALIGFTTVPLAPPRYMPEFGFMDTIIHAQSYYVVPEPEDRESVRRHAQPAFRLGSAGRDRHRLPARTSAGCAMSRIFMPFVMLGGIVLTANHYFLDAAAGALVACIGPGHRLAPAAAASGESRSSASSRKRSAREVAARLSQSTSL